MSNYQVAIKPTDNPDKMKVVIVDGIPADEDFGTPASDLELWTLEPGEVPRFVCDEITRQLRDYQDRGHLRLEPNQKICLTNQVISWPDPYHTINGQQPVMFPNCAWSLGQGGQVGLTSVQVIN